MTNIEVRTQNIYENLSNAEKKVAAYFLDNVENVFAKPISQLAEESGVSKVAWVRFCKAIGFDGLKDLKKSLFSELHETAGEPAEAAAFSDIREATGIDQLILSVKNNSIRAVRDTTKLLDPASVEAAARQILNARSVRIFGVGASALVGEDLYNKLLRIDKNVCFCRDLHIQLTYAANMTPQDVAVLISMSGNTKEVLEMLALSRQCGTPTVALTKFDKSVLAQNADIRLYISAPEATPRSGAMSSRIAQMVAVDVLFTAVAHLDYDRAAASLEKSRESCRPPGGAGAPPLRRGYSDPRLPPHLTGAGTALGGPGAFCCYSRRTNASVCTPSGRDKTAAETCPSTRCKSAWASLASTPHRIITMAVLAEKPASSKTPRARSGLTPVAQQTMDTARATSFWLLAHTSTIRLLYTFPSFTITAVDSIFSTIFCAVPLFRRVEPVTTSGPGCGAMPISAAASMAEPGQQVSPITGAPNARA